PAIPQPVIVGGHSALTVVDLHVIGISVDQLDGESLKRRVGEKVQPIRFKNHVGCPIEKEGVARSGIRDNIDKPVRGANLPEPARRVGNDDEFRAFEITMEELGCAKGGIGYTSLDLEKCLTRIDARGSQTELGIDASHFFARTRTGRAFIELKI